MVIDRSGKSILPALTSFSTTFNLIDIEHEYNPPDGIPAYARFQDQLSEIENNYDFVLYDCPPKRDAGGSMWTLQRQRGVCALQSRRAFPRLVSPCSRGNYCSSVSVQRVFAAVAWAKPPNSGLSSSMGGGAIKPNVDIEVPKMRMQFRFNQYRNQKIGCPNAKIFGASIRDAGWVGARRAVDPWSNGELC